MDRKMTQTLDFAFQKGFEERLTLIRSIDPGRVLNREMRMRRSVRDLVEGDQFRLNHRVYHVNSLGACREYDEAYTRPLDYTCTEFRCMDLVSGATAYFEWEEDDELLVYASERKLSFKDLSDDAGKAVDEDDLEQIVNEEDSLFLDGRPFHYDDDWAAMYTRSGRPEGEKVYVYEFEADDGACLTIEEWNEGKKSSDYELWLCRKVNPDDFEILTGDPA
jgi:hypothetical protein